MVLSLAGEKEEIKVVSRVLLLDCEKVGMMVE
jgi:hypothetical protein